MARQNPWMEFSATERKFILMIGGVIALVVIIQLLRPHIIPPPVYDYSHKDSIFESRSQLPSAPRIVRESSGEKVTLSGKNGIRPVNLNTAGRKEIEQLPRIGPVTAARIIEYREKNGGFNSPNDLLNVKGIGPKTLERLLPYLRFEQ